MPPSQTHSGDDYYALLGVHAGVDEEALRTAWRRMAARWHPDRAGVAATARFQQLSAAYTVLSDPISRAAYDRKRGRTSAPVSAATRKPAEPHRSAAATSAAPPTSSASPPAVMLKRLSGALTLVIARGAAHLEEEGYITLILTEHEAAQGGMVMISMRVPLTCPACTGKQLTMICPRCKGERVVEELYSAWLAVPPGVKGGEVLRPTVGLPGMIKPVQFRLQIRE